VIVPESWETITDIEHLYQKQKLQKCPLRVATKFPNLTEAFFSEKHDFEFQLIQAEGTLEIAPTVGYADIIVDLVSTGTTLRDNRLKPLSGGEILCSEACLIANKARLKFSSETLTMATQLLEFIGAHLRANDRLAIFANVRGKSPESIAQLVFQQEVISGLQGPTVSQVITRQGQKWFAVHLVVRKNQLHQAIREIRDIGGSGVVVSPVSYIFEEEPNEISNMIAALEY